MSDNNGNSNNNENDTIQQQPDNLEFQSFTGNEDSTDTSVPIEDQPVPGDESDYQSPLLYDNQNNNNNNDNNNNRDNSRKDSSWSLHYFITRFGAHRYFDVDTNQVVDRVVRALLPFRLSFLDAVKDNPDLYGPFWVTTTLVVVLSVAANLGSYFDFLSSNASSHATTSHIKFPSMIATSSSTPSPSPSSSSSSSPTPSSSANTSSAEWAMNFHYVTVSAGTMYGYVLLVPLLVWGILRWRRVKVSFLQTIALFGYSLAALVPATALCVVPLWYLRLAFILLGLSDASAFLILNLVPVFRKSPGLLAPGVGFVLLAHAALGVAFMLYFFA
eukprot:gb/GECH01002896.1/.p1 GENE.gb/GECH01002896.1/~~gb/GECH01002896.1/.p1  ORF type:complete len:330 (+),score=61.36 gb/GECH01002896.1/:1-990(+)